MSSAYDTAHPPRMLACVTSRFAPTRKLAGLGTTIFTEMTQLADAHGAVNLAQGFPDFDGPEFVKEAAADALRRGMAQYAPVAGVAPLRAALAEKYRRDYGLDYSVDEFTVTSGASEALFCAITSLCDVGDEVILLEPFYDVYRAAVYLAGAIPRCVELRYPDFAVDADALSRAFSPRTKMIVVNTPHNPTGRVLDDDERALIARLCVKHDVVCLSDEVYEHIVFDGAHRPLALLPGMRERTLTVSSVSKTFSLTGWRVGWAAAPAVLSRAIRGVKQFITFAAPTPLQHAAAVAVAAPADYFTQLTATYRARRDQLVAGLQRVGFEPLTPQGTYFVCAGFSRFGFTDDVAFCRHLVERVGVAAIPPSGFYDQPRAQLYVRFVFLQTRRDAGGGARAHCKRSFRRSLPKGEAACGPDANAPRISTHALQRRPRPRARGDGDRRPPPVGDAAARDASHAGLLPPACRQRGAAGVWPRLVVMPDTADLWTRDLTGRLTTWVECGNADAAKLRKVQQHNSGAVLHIVMDDARRAAELTGELAATRLPRGSTDPHLWMVDAQLAHDLAAREDRRQKWAVTVVGDHLYIDVDGQSCDGAVTQSTLPGGA